MQEQATERAQSKSEALEVCIALARRGLTDTLAAMTELVRKYPNVYWDIPSENLQGEQHAAFVIERMLEKGTLKGVQDLLILFSRRRIAAVVANSKRLSRRTALFWKNVLSIEGPIYCLDKESPNPLSMPWH